MSEEYIAQLEKVSLKIATAINELEGGINEWSICVGLIHTLGKFTMSDVNPHNKDVSKEKRKERLLSMLNMVLNIYDEKLKFEE